MKFTRLALGLIIIALAAFIQIVCASWGTPFDLVLVTLIVASFFFSFFELLILSLWGAALLQWSPAIGLELILTLIIPLVIFGLRLLFPWKGWFSFFLTGVLGIFAFNIATSGTVPFHFWGVFAGDIFITMIYGTIIFSIFQSLYEKKQFFGSR